MNKNFQTAEITLTFLQRIIPCDQNRISDPSTWPYSENPCSGILLSEPVLQTYYLLISENDLIWLISMQKGVPFTLRFSHALNTHLLKKSIGTLSKVISGVFLDIPVIFLQFDNIKPLYLPLLVISVVPY